MSLQANAQLIERYFEEVWNQGRVDVLDELLTSDYRNHSPGLADPPPGPEGLKPIVLMMREAIPDLHYTIEDLVLAPDRVAAYVRMTGTQTGSFFGIAPSSKAIDVRQMQIEWIRDGKISQHWRITEDLKLMRQLGVIL
ncbi:SnoaL-like polyketide cyclase [Duganella sp. CF458]|uniref:ester cyclase n=1 Tax=Duganella sp. CF458 TaxID=1884368 RepID=UPI0008E602A9|nr:ester cyclase [Duganella sp. CF458]SFG28846.1 SnoaL-like polyketide cyclase [Duganella sp. CF458]